MALTRQQELANEKFFDKMFSISKMYIWPDERETFEIQGSNITCTKKGYNALKGNTSLFWLKKYTFTIK